MAIAGRGDDQYMVRFPEGMRDQVKTAAAQNGRSMNAELIARLQQSFEVPELLEKLSLSSKNMKLMEEIISYQRKSLDLTNSFMEDAKRIHAAQDKSINFAEISFGIASAFALGFLRSVREAAQGDRDNLERLVNAVRAKPDIFSDLEESLSVKIDYNRSPKRKDE